MMEGYLWYSRVLPAGNVKKLRHVREVLADASRVFRRVAIPKLDSTFMGVLYMNTVGTVTEKSTISESGG